MKDANQELPSCRRANVALTIVGDELTPEDITRIVGVTPTRSYSKGDEFEIQPGRFAKRPSGLWCLESEASVRSPEIADHLAYLVQALQHRTDALVEWGNTSAAQRVISVWWEGNFEEGGYSIPADLLERLSTVCDRVDFFFLAGSGSDQAD